MNELFIKYDPPHYLRYLRSTDGVVRRYYQHMDDFAWLLLCDRLEAMKRVLFPLVEARRPMSHLDILEIACDMRSAASDPYGSDEVLSSVTGRPLLQSEYRDITNAFWKMPAAQLPILVSVCELMLDAHFGTLWNRSDAHLTPADRERVENKLWLHMASEIPISPEVAPDINYVPAYRPDTAWKYRMSILARKLGLPHPDSQFRLHMLLPLSLRDPRYNLEGRFVG